MLWREHAVDVPGRGRLTGVFASTKTVRGQLVGLRLDLGGCMVYPAAPAT